MYTFTRHRRLHEVLQTPFPITSETMFKEYTGRITNTAEEARLYNIHFATPDNDVYMVSIEAQSDPPRRLGIGRSPHEQLYNPHQDMRTWKYWRVDFGVESPGEVTSQNMDAHDASIDDLRQVLGTNKHEFRVFSTIAGIMQKFLSTRLHTPNYEPVDVMLYACWAGATESRKRLYRSFMKLIPQRMPEYMGMDIGYGTGNVPHEMQFAIVRRDMEISPEHGPYTKYWRR